MTQLNLVDSFKEFKEFKNIVSDDAVEDENQQIGITDALRIEDDFEVGEEYSEEIKLESFGRRNVLSLRQNLAGRIMELEKDSIYQKYKERVGEIISAEVYQIWKREILLVDDEDNRFVSNGSRIFGAVV